MRFTKATNLTFSEVEQSAETCATVTETQLGFVTDTHTYGQRQTLINQCRRRHWLLAPDEVGKETMLNWLSGVSAAWGTGYADNLVENAALTMGLLNASDCADVYESLEQYDNAIVAAQTDLRNCSNYPPPVVQSHLVIGRCLAKLGRLQAAAAAFESAIEMACMSEMLFLELLARNDYIVHVLDQQCKRGEQVAALGGCIERMVLAACKYTAVLGLDLDAEAAVEALRAKFRPTSTVG